MSESELGGFIQVAPYPLEAVPYQLFAKMIGRKVEFRHGKDVPWGTL